MYQRKQDAKGSFPFASIIYKISGTYSGTVIDSFYLIRESKGAVSSYSIQRTDKCSDDKRLEFLKSLLKL